MKSSELPENEQPREGFKGKKNIYVCEKCFGHIVTVDLAEGVTPFMVGCKANDGCDGMMQSSFYRVYDQRIRPSYEWYRPNSLDGLKRGVHEHVENGGLLLREIGHD